MSNRSRCFFVGLLIGLLLFCGLSFSQRALSSAAIDPSALVQPDLVQSDLVQSAQDPSDLIQQGRSQYQSGRFAQAAEFWQQAAAAAAF